MSDTDAERSTVPGGRTPSPWKRYAVLSVLGLVVLAGLVFSMVTVIPRWWAGVVGRQAFGTLAGGIGWGVFYGFVFTAGALLVASLAFVRRWKGVTTRLAFIALGIIIAAPNLLTLSVVVGTHDAAHAGERILDTTAPGFRWSTAISAIAAGLVVAAIWVLRAVRSRALREVARLRAAREQQDRAGSGSAGRAPEHRHQPQPARASRRR